MFLTKELSKNVVIGLLVALLGISVYFNYVWWKDKESLGDQIKNRSSEIGQTIFSGTLTSISEEKLVLTTEDATKEFSLTKDTVYKKSPLGGGVLIPSQKDELAAGQEIVVILEEGSAKVKEVNILSSEEE